jgi:hypothetical protein
MSVGLEPNVRQQFDHSVTGSGGEPPQHVGQVAERIDPTDARKFRRSVLLPASQKPWGVWIPRKRLRFWDERADD